MRISLLAVILALTGCAREICAEGIGTEPNRFLWKTYKRSIPPEPVSGQIKAGTRFLTGDLGNYGVCQEVADLYNAKPSIVEADVLIFSCGPR